MPGADVLRSRFVVAPIFGVRPTGVPFDVLDRLATPAIAQLARGLVSLEYEASATAAAALERLVDELATIPTLRDRLETRIRRRRELSPERLASHPWLEPYDRAVRQLSEAEAELGTVIEREYRRVHDVLVREAGRELPDYLTIESEAFADEVDRMTGAADRLPAGHASKDRRRARSLALYLQRVCAKNETVSRFGPCAWGTIVPGARLCIRPEPGVADRRVEVERWVVQGLIDVMNAEPDVRAETCPRLHPHGRLEADGFWRLDEDRAIPLSDEERAIAIRCDGKTAAHELGNPKLLERLVECGVIRWALEPIARDTAPLSSLLRDVAGWRAANRDRWQPRLETIAELARRFAVERLPAERRAIVSELRAQLEATGFETREHTRTLYAARNPINENCLQTGVITVGAEAMAAMVAEASPWFELFRDSVALAATRTYHRLIELVRAAPRRGGSLSYSTLVHVARQHGINLDDASFLEHMGGETFRDITRELGELLGQRPDAQEWRLTTEECTFLRRRHQFPPGGELTWPSADLQLCAASLEDAEAGRLQWVVAELHWAPVLMQHAMYWSCPDKPAVHLAISQAHEGRPFCMRDAGNAAPVHVSVAAAFDLPGGTYVGTGRANPAWRVVRPADAEVVVDESSCDIRLRAAGEDIGSIIRSAALIGGMHPFYPFVCAPHAPRLLLGNVVVQRQTWHVDSAAIGEPRPSGVSAGFVAGIERLRAERGIPRWVFARPAPGTLATRGAKDNKPLYVDLESVVFLDILERRLRKYGTLVFSEMLPTPDQLIWRLPDGRFTFEIRTNLVPG